MIDFDTPGINEFASPEDNIMQIKSWATSLVEGLYYQIQQLEDEIYSLRSEISQLKEEKQ